MTIVALAVKIGNANINNPQPNGWGFYFSPKYAWDLPPAYPGRHDDSCFLAAKLASLPALLDRYAGLIESRMNDAALPSAMRASWRYLWYHAQLCRKYAFTFRRKAEGRMEEAAALLEELKDFVWSLEPKLHHVFDAYEFWVSMNRYVVKKVCCKAAQRVCRKFRGRPQTVKEPIF